MKHSDPDFLDICSATSEIPTTPAVQSAAEPGLEQVVMMFNKALSLCHAYLNNNQRVSNFQR